MPAPGAAARARRGDHRLPRAGRPEVVRAGLEVIVAVDIAVNDGPTFLDFEDAVTAVPEVTEVRRMLGQPDYYLRVQVADIEAFEELIVAVISRLPAVSRILSHQTMRLVKG
ncbi:Lrp/AsnC ligand binding domain-containing protein [Janibacter corallicola]|uniref:Lrp/AsnC ligand binding domain-containing protein n=1 Tax=Janibacter corallicola TaxID=415212 RepID=UPI000A64A774|nr:Lrp/AsnC ligand binding domain-containing protein [Janibacter corallicola]